MAKKACIVLKFSQNMYFDAHVHFFCKKYQICPNFPDFPGFPDYADFAILLPFFNDDYRKLA